MNALDRQEGGNHYKALAIQPVEYIHRNKLGWLEGTAIKHITRHRSKNGAEDIKKAIHYLEMLLEFDYPERIDGIETLNPNKSGVGDNWYVPEGEKEWKPTVTG